MWAAMSCTAAPRMEEIMENQSLIHREANCLSRFDRLPVKSEMLKIIAVLAAVSVVEAFDLGLIGQTVLVLKQIWNLGPAETGLLATCSTIGVPSAAASFRTVMVASASFSGPCSSSRSSPSWAP